MKRLAFCFDCTWNDIEMGNPTNVAKTAQAIAHSEPARAVPSQGEIEAAQLMAFEAGEENWWIATGIDAREGEGNPSVNPDALEEGA